MFVLSSTSKGNAYNLNNPHYLSWEKYIKLVNKELAINIKQVATYLWQTQYLANCPQSNALYTLKTFYEQPIDDNLNKKIETAKTQHELQKFDVYYPNQYEQLMSLYIQYLRDTNFI